MIKFENVSVAGFEAAIRGMRNPKNSWSKSDSHPGLCGDEWAYDPGYIIGSNDKELMLKLNAGGPVHAKYRRQIVVWVDITAPLYWWKEFDTYRFGRERNSCSTMHKIAEREFTLDDFSNEYLDDSEVCAEYIDDGPYVKAEFTSMDIHRLTIKALNHWRNEYLKATEAKNTEWAKHCWWQLIQLNPDCYNQRATIMMSYEVLANIRKFRKNHKLDEWADSFMEFIERLPYSWIITADATGMEVAQPVKKPVYGGVMERRYEPDPYDLSDENKQRIMETPDVEPEFFCRLNPLEIPDFNQWMNSSRAMDLYLEGTYVGRLWSIEPIPNDPLGICEFSFVTIDHETGKNLLVDYAHGRYTRSFETVPGTQIVRMRLNKKE